MQVAPGTGMISAVVLMSDDLDEIDIGEWSGNNFAANHGIWQTNYFGKGLTGNYDRSTAENVESPQTQFHTYTVDWSPTSIVWSLDGRAVRTLNNNGATDGAYQFPQSPSRLHLSLWTGGDADSAPGVVGWAGGYTDLSKVPYTAFVKSVKITTPNPCSSWQFPADFSGQAQDVTCTNTTLSTKTSTSQVAATTTSGIKSATATTYAVQVGDYGMNVSFQNM